MVLLHLAQSSKGDSWSNWKLPQQLSQQLMHVDVAWCGNTVSSVSWSHMVWTFSICLSPHSCTTRMRPLDAERHRAVGRETKLIGAQGAVEIRRYPATFGSTATGEELHPNILHFGVPWNILKLSGHGNDPGNAPTNQQDPTGIQSIDHWSVKMRCEGDQHVDQSHGVPCRKKGSLLLTTSCNIPQQWDDHQMTNGTIWHNPKWSPNI